MSDEQSKEDPDERSKNVTAILSDQGFQQT